MNISFGTHVDLKGFIEKGDSEKKVKFRTMPMPSNIKTGVNKAVDILQDNGKRDSVQIQYTKLNDDSSYLTIETTRGISAFQSWNFIGKKPEEIKDMLINTYEDLTKKH